MAVTLTASFLSAFLPLMSTVAMCSLISHREPFGVETQPSIQHLGQQPPFIATYPLETIYMFSPSRACRQGANLLSSVNQKRVLTLVNSSIPTAWLSVLQAQRVVGLESVGVDGELCDRNKFSSEAVLPETSMVAIKIMGSHTACMFVWSTFCYRIWRAAGCVWTLRWTGTGMKERSALLGFWMKMKIQRIPCTAAATPSNLRLASRKKKVCQHNKAFVFSGLVKWRLILCFHLHRLC